jgi:hypothetical protein
MGLGFILVSLGLAFSLCSRFVVILLETLSLI